MKKGDKVILCMFTGCKTAVKEVVKADKKTITIVANNGKELIFDAKTLKQIEPAPKAEKWANYIMEDDGSFVPKAKKKAEKKEKVSGVTKAEPEEEKAEEEKAEEAPKKKKAEKKPKTEKKSKKAEEEEAEWNDDDFDEDEFVEV